MVVPVVAEDGRVYYRPADPHGAHYAPPPPTHHVAPPQMYPAPYAGSPPFYGSPPIWHAALRVLCCSSSGVVAASLRAAPASATSKPF